MDVAEPYRAVCPTLEGPVLAVLAGTSSPLTGRDVARLVHRGSWSGVRRTLQRLVEHGLVLMEEAGPAHLYRFNRSHVAARAVEMFLLMPAEVINRLSHNLREFPVPPIHVSMFGSAARGDGTIESDIDLFVVRPTELSAEAPDWRDPLDRLAENVHRWTGNHAAIVEVSEDEAAALDQTDPRLAGDLRRDAIVLIGDPIASVLGARG